METEVTMMTTMLASIQSKLIGQDTREDTRLFRGQRGPEQPEDAQRTWDGIDRTQGHPSSGRVDLLIKSDCNASGFRAAQRSPADLQSGPHI
eukprot:1368333-Pyramimonas_sp.AAC.1